MRRLLVLGLLLLPLFLWSCDVDIEGPCFDEDCSGRGDCIMVEEQGRSIPWCRCDTGYMVSPDGLTCYLPGGPPADAGRDGQ